MLYLPANASVYFFSSFEVEILFSLLGILFWRYTFLGHQIIPAHLHILGLHYLYITYNLVTMMNDL